MVGITRSKVIVFLIFEKSLIQDLVPQTELKEKITEFCKKHGIVMGNESVSSAALENRKKNGQGGWGMMGTSSSDFPFLQV